jgi:hypothetical protein
VYCRVKPCVDEALNIIKYPELSSLSNEIEQELYSVEVKNNKSNEVSIFNFDKIFTEKSTQEEVI